MKTFQGGYDELVNYPGKRIRIYPIFVVTLLVVHRFRRQRFYFQNTINFNYHCLCFRFKIWASKMANITRNTYLFNKYRNHLNFVYESFCQKQHNPRPKFMNYNNHTRLISRYLQKRLSLLCSFVYLLLSTGIAIATQ